MDNQNYELGEWWKSWRERKFRETRLEWYIHGWIIGYRQIWTERAGAGDWLGQACAKNRLSKPCRRAGQARKKWNSVSFQWRFHGTRLNQSECGKTWRRHRTVVTPAKPGEEAIQVRFSHLHPTSNHQPMTTTMANTNPKVAIMIPFLDSCTANVHNLLLIPTTPSFKSRVGTLPRRDFAPTTWRWRFSFFVSQRGSSGDCKAMTKEYLDFIGERVLLFIVLNSLGVAWEIMGIGTNRLWCETTPSATTDHSCAA